MPIFVLSQEWLEHNSINDARLVNSDDDGGRTNDPWIIKLYQP